MRRLLLDRDKKTPREPSRVSDETPDNAAPPAHQPPPPAQPPAPPPQPPTPPQPHRVGENIQWGRIAWSVLCALLIWGGEAIVGVLPLGAHAIVANHLSITGEITQDDAAEICILSVVISGLALISLLEFGPRRRTAQFTPITYVLSLFALVSVIAGALFYGLVTAHVAKDVGTIIYYFLYIALASSCFVAIERAIIEA
jgi:hypothetical protein